MVNVITRHVLIFAALLGLIAGCDSNGAKDTTSGSGTAKSPNSQNRSGKIPGRRPETVARPVTGRGFVPSPSTELVLSEEARRALLGHARQVCEGKEADPGAAVRQKPAGVEATNAILITLYKKEGGRLGSQRVDGATTDLFQKLDDAVPNLCAGTDFDDIYLHLAVVSTTARLPNFGIKGIFEYKVFEPLVTGIAYELDGKRFELDPLRQAELNFGPNNTRQFLAEQFGAKPEAINGRNDLIIEIYRVIHFGERYPDRTFADFHRGHVRLEAKDVTHELLGERLALISDWYRNNVIDGEVTYKYAPSPMKFVNDERTMVRSTMAVWILNRLAFYLGDEELKRLGEETIATYLERYFNIEQSRAKGAIIGSTVPLKSGDVVKNRYTAASFTAAAMLERDDWPSHRTDMAMLMAYAMGFAREDGLMWTQFAESQFFMPGQLLLAVSYAFEKTGEATYRDFFDKVWTTYETPLRQMMALGNEVYIPLAPAWYTQPTASMYHQTKEPRYRDLVFEINDRVAKIYDLNAQYQVYYDYDGAMTPKLGFYGNNSVTAAALESLVDAAIVARSEGDEARFSRYQAVIRQVVAFLLRLQLIPANTYYMKGRQQVVGGFKTDLVNSHVWMDNVWHLTSAFIKIHKNNVL